MVCKDTDGVDDFSTCLGVIGSFMRYDIARHVILMSGELSRMLNTSNQILLVCSGVVSDGFRREMRMGAPELRSGRLLSRSIVDDLSQHFCTVKLSILSVRGS